MVRDLEYGILGVFAGYVPSKHQADCVDGKIILE